MQCLQIPWFYFESHAFPYQPLIYWPFFSSVSPDERRKFAFFFFFEVAETGLSSSAEDVDS